MVFLCVIVAFVVIIIGLIIKMVLDKAESDLEVTWLEFAIGTFATCVILAPLTVWGGWQIAKNEAITYNEFWHGWEVSVQKNKIVCEQDGSCAYTFECDPYEVMETYECNCGKNGCDTCTRMVTKYHDCPYENAEYNYYIHTTLGEYTIATHRFPDNPQANRWDDGDGHDREESLDLSTIGQAGVGDPPFWVAAKERTDNMRPGPVTKTNSYKNFILASDSTILKQYSGSIAKYKKMGVLPSLNSGIYSFYCNDKVFVVGSLDDKKAWDTKLSYLNAALGTDLQGDFYLVIVTDKRILMDKDEYPIALKAYWGDKKVFDKDALPKNSIVVVVGASNDIIIWARAFTGMPLGNEEMLTAIQSQLRGAQLKPEVVIGDVVGIPKAQYSSAVVTNHGMGVLEKVVFGVDDKGFRFKRVSMSAKDKNDVGTGFTYLMREVQISNGAKVGIGFGAGFISSLVWLIFVFVGQRADKKRSSDWR